MKINEMKFSECSYSSVALVLESYHYLRRMPAGILACYCMFDENQLNKVVAAAVFCNGRIQYENIFIEFSRLWVCDDFGKNSETYFMAKCLRQLQKKYPNYRGVVTWADPKQNHNGTIYVASNFVFDGMSRKVAKYVGASGRQIYQRTATKDSIQIGVDKPKKRFVYYFDKKQREQKRQTT